MKREITIEEARGIIEEYPTDESYIEIHYSMGFHPEVGMTDNSIQLHEYWHRCKEIVDENPELLNA